MSQAVGAVRWTIQDIEALPENEGIRYEIIDGELFVTRSPNPWKPIVDVCNILANWCDKIDADNVWTS